MFAKLGATALLASTLLVDRASAILNLAQKNNAVVYWGQNAYGGDDVTVNNTQWDLFKTCNDTNVDAVIISFVTKFKGTSNYPVINLSNQCWTPFVNATSQKNTDILNCTDVGSKITQCQSIGKKILLSLGGQSYTDPGWKDVASARSSANEIWAMFGPKSLSPTFPYRPFGNATVDGFDLDFEYAANAPQTDAFAKQMKNLYLLDTTRKYLLTAAPQCPNPDAALNKALTTVAFDAVFIQFYNNNCGANKWVAKKAALAKDNNTWNLKLWQDWATKSSANKQIALFTGFLAGGLPGQTGYVPRATAQQIVADSKQFANFRGASFWDSSILNVNSLYLPSIKQTLNTSPIKRSAEPEPVDIKHPVNEETSFPNEGVFQEAAAAEIKRHRRHHHHRRTGF